MVGDSEGLEETAVPVFSVELVVSVEVGVAVAAVVGAVVVRAGEAVFRAVVRVPAEEVVGGGLVPGEDVDVCRGGVFVVDTVCAGVLVAVGEDDAPVGLEVTAALDSSALLVDVCVVDKRTVVVVCKRVDCGGEELAVVVWGGDVVRVSVLDFCTGVDETAALVLGSGVLARVEAAVVVRVEVGAVVVPAGEEVS